MPLTVKFTAVLSADATNVVVTDTTGDYDATTNPGGYGFPNPERWDVTAILLTLKSYAKDSVPTTIMLDGTMLSQIQSQMAVPIPATLFGFTDTFTDSVYLLKYSAVYVGYSFVTATEGSKVITSIDDLTLALPSGVSAFVLPDVDIMAIHYLDQTKPVEVDKAYVTEGMPAVTDQALYPIYQAVADFSVSNTGDDCLARDIGMWADQGCCCEKTDPFDLLTRYKYQMAIDVKITQGYPHDAQVLIEKLNSYCENNCGC